MRELKENEQVWNDQSGMGQRKRILLIEDQEEIAALVKLHAELGDYKVQVETDGINGYRAIEREKPDLVLLDIMLPGENGFDICRKMKNHPALKKIPVIILSARQEEIDIVLGLELGADDYIAKPFSPKVLLSRMKAVLRREKESQKNPKSMKFSEFLLDIEEHVLRKGNQSVALTLSEFGILRRLVANKGKVLTRNQLLSDVNNDDSFIVDRNIDVHIASLRKKMGPTFDGIETVRGIGYRFREESILPSA